MRGIVICMASQLVTLRTDLAIGLLGRIRLYGGPDRASAEQPLLTVIGAGGSGQVNWPHEGKHAVFAAINGWMEETDASVPAGVMELRTELMRDLRVPPFDD